MLRSQAGYPAPMWLVRELGRRQSPELNAFQELVADGEVLSNAVNHVDWSESEVLLNRCTYCGGDDADGWVAPRRSGDLVVLQPKFEDPASLFAPPAPFARAGIAVVPHATLRAAVKRLPPLDELPPWTMDDAVRALQFESIPLLGSFPDEPHIATDAVVACSKEILEEGLAALRTCLERFSHRGESVLLEPLPEGEDPVWFYVEGLEPLDWFPIAEVDGTPVPHFAPGLVALPR